MRSIQQVHVRIADIQVQMSDHYACRQTSKCACRKPLVHHSCYSSRLNALIITIDNRLQHIARDEPGLAEDCYNLTPMARGLYHPRTLVSLNKASRLHEICDAGCRMQGIPRHTWGTFRINQSLFFFDCRLPRPMKFPILCCYLPTTFTARKSPLPALRLQQRIVLTCINHALQPNSHIVAFT